MFFKDILKKNKRNRIYLDYASSTPFDIKMHKTFPELSNGIKTANPSALHKEGVEAKNILKESRKKVATILGANSDEIIFTSGATESDNLAVKGIVNKWLNNNIKVTEILIITTDLEHSAITESVRNFEKKGVRVNTLISSNGVIDPKNIIISDEYKKIFVSILYVNNEIGTIQPLNEIAKKIRYLRKRNPDKEIVFHSDATQAVAHLPVNINKLGVDLLTLGSTKLYTTKAVGLLFKKRHIELEPIINGGGQEFRLRAGTEDVQGIYFFSESLSYAESRKIIETERIKKIKDFFEEEIKRKIPEVVISAESLSRSPHICHVAVRGIDSELLVLEMDARGIAVSTKSACKNDNDINSIFVENIHGSNYGFLRFSFGRNTSKNDIEYSIKALKCTINKYRINNSTY